MKFAEEIKTTAIVGTGQKEFTAPETGGALGITISKIDGGDKEKHLLAAAAVFSSWQAAGKTLPFDVLDKPEIAEADEKKILTGRLRQIFETLLQTHEKTGLLPEFLGLMEKYDRIIPPELLPPAFEAANGSSHERDFRRPLLPAAGNRGKWLARQNPDWRWALVGERAEEMFETGKTAERIFALEFIRETDAGKALEMIHETWKTEGARERQKLIGVLRTNLSEQDEDFLLDIFHTDRSAEVKRTAFELLADLPDSKLSAEITEIFHSVISVKKIMLLKKEIEVNLPSDWTEKTANLRFAASQIFSDKRYFGEKAMALVVGLSVINPTVWEKSLNMKPDEIVSLAHKSDWARALLAGFGMASIRFEKEKWLAEVLKFNSKFALSLSPLLAWGERSFSYISKRKLSSLIVSHPQANFSHWLLPQLSSECDEVSEVFRNFKSGITNFLRTQSNAGWAALIAFLPYKMIDDWILWLEEFKEQKDTKDYEKMRCDESIDILKIRKEYKTEFETL